MLSYQHGYHAGCLADVHKHGALAALLVHLAKKPKPLSYLETHAGRAVYDLSAPEAEKTGEARAGILRLMAEGAIPAEQPFGKVLRMTEQAYGAGHYPGSPLIAAQLLRQDDVLHLMEMHPEEIKALKRAMRRHRAHIHHRDGYEGVLGISPPTPRRGLVLIDPSYEIKSEYLRVAEFVPALHRRWPEATIMVWYPILEAGLHEAMAGRLVASDLPEVVHREVRFRIEPGAPGMRGSGLIIVNTPWGAGEALDAAERMLDPVRVKPAA